MSHKQLHPSWLGIALLVIAAAVLCGEASNPADLGPQPPCGSATLPPYPALDEPPTTKAWSPSDLGPDWAPPACVGWTEKGFTSLVVTAARLRNTHGIEGLLRRVGAISKLEGMRYWSTTHKRWQTLIVRAYALPGPTGAASRDDFSPDEIEQGKSLYFLQEDNLSGKAIYRLRVQIVSPDRLVFDTENTSTIRHLLWPLFRPREIQSIYFLERESRDVWRYYSLTRTGKRASSLTAGHDASSINRAVAFFRYLAGIPTDEEPPAAP